MLLLIGPAVAVVGIVAVFFVMRHKSVEKHSMYAARRSQIEHKVRAARQRTLAPVKHGEKEAKTTVGSPSAPTLTYEPSAYAAPPVAPPRTTHEAPAQSAWDASPSPATAPAPSTPAVPGYDQPTAAPAPAYEPPPAEQAPWTPSPPAPEPVQPQQAAPAPAAETAAAGGGASWSVVGETKASAEPEPEPAKKKKKSKEDAKTSAWQLASGEAPSDEADEGPRKPSAVLAIAQYLVLVVGLVMVLIGVVVMVANSHVT